jgi:FkbM family methyltransferase
MLARLIRAALGLVGVEAVRLPGRERRLLFMGRRTRREVGPDLLLHEQLKRLFERYAIDCVLDVGANTGQYAIELRHAGYRGRLLSFEPVPHLCERLRAAAAGDPAWSIHPIALGPRTGIAELNVTRHDVFTSFREPLPFAGQRFGEATEVARRERVAVRRLEDVLDELFGGGPPPRCFLKMDTQGYDLEVFAGLGRWAERVIGLQSEVAAIPLYTGMPRMADAIARYEAAGFELTGLFPVSRDEPTGRVIEFDCVMVRAAARPSA